MSSVVSSGVDLVAVCCVLFLVAVFLATCGDGKNSVERSFHEQMLLEAAEDDQAVWDHRSAVDHSRGGR